MIDFVHGNIFTSRAEALVNPVNCVGVMGAGLALAFKKRYPEASIAYMTACHRGEVATGRIFTYEAKPLIFHFPTKRHFHDDSRIEDIESGLRALALEIPRRGVRSVAVPALGCGLGGLSWAKVRPRIEMALTLVDATVTVYEPE